MQNSNALLLFTIFINMIFISSSLLFAQDTTGANSDSSKTVQSTADIDIGQEDVILEEIDIKGEIEKPRVSILPKRIEPELGELEFIDRSFENELKQGPEKPFLIKERVGAPVKVKKLKNKLKGSK